MQVIIYTGYLGKKEEPGPEFKRAISEGVKRLITDFVDEDYQDVPEVVFLMDSAFIESIKKGG